MVGIRTDLYFFSSLSLNPSLCIYHCLLLSLLITRPFYIKISIYPHSLFISLPLSPNSALFLPFCLYFFLVLKLQDSNLNCASISVSFKQVFTFFFLSSSFTTLLFVRTQSPLTLLFMFLLFLIYFLLLFFIKSFFIIVRLEILLEYID